MKINIRNYEAYFTEYLDGQLSLAAQQELQAFLFLHPDLKEMLEGMKMTKLTPPVIRYALKNNLKKEEVHECTDYYAIAWAEKTISSEEIKMLNHHSRKKEIYRDAALYDQLKLVAPDLRYENKKKLYRPQYRFFSSYFYTGLAASLLIFAGISLLFQQSAERDDTLIKTIPPAMQAVAEIPKNKSYQPNLSAMSLSRPRRVPFSETIITEKLSLSAPITVLNLPIATIPQIPYTIPDCESLCPMRSAHPREILLTEEAKVWKSSGNSFLAENVFSGMFQTGRLLAEKIKTNLNGE